MKKLMNKIEHSIFILFLLVSAQLASAAEVVTYLHTDMLGSVVAATNSNGAVVYTEEYKPYGERIHRQDNGQDSSWYSGHSEDQDTRLTYMGARWYDPAIGRFLAIDPAGVNPEDIHTFNRYSYANNNPYKYIDPDGERVKPSSSQVPIEIQNGYALGGIAVLGTMLTYGLAGAAGAYFAGSLDIAFMAQTVADGGPIGRTGIKVTPRTVTKSAPIRGNAQVTRKAGSETTHASTSQRIANQEALRTDAQSVHLNQQIGTITNGQVKSRVRPDVATVRSDGKIDAFEVLSPGQTVQQQTRKLQNALGNRAGNITCVACD